MSLLEPGVSIPEIAARIGRVPTADIAAIRDEIYTRLGKLVLAEFHPRALAIQACLKAYHPPTWLHEMRTGVRHQRGLEVLGHRDTPDGIISTAGAVMHDTGKLAVRLLLINAPHKLEGADLEEMESHTRKGVDLAGGVMPDARPYMAGHHEQKLDQTRRYPRQVPRFPRGPHEGWMLKFMARVDALDALMDPNRLYRQPLEPTDALHQVYVDFGPGYEEALEAAASVRLDMAA